LDANVIFAALIRNSHTRDLLLTTGWNFYAPEFVLNEVYSHIQTLSEKTGLDAKEVKDLLAKLTLAADVKIIPASEFEEHLKQAKRICPDPDDIHYFALALKLNCAIWSNEKKLKEQANVKVYSTGELSRKR